MTRNASYFIGLLRWAGSGRLVPADLPMAVPVPWLAQGDPASRDESCGVRRSYSSNPFTEEDF
ncbi:MAG TPA: hypothetical protein VI733_05495 [Candidatus Limnocylindria bacterium]|nr:hypothetical protein [Candidatus Limnocylindria bacterium]